MEEKNDVLEYVEKKLDEVGYKDLPVREMYSKEDWEVTKKARKEEKILDTMYIMAIGFANGVKYERENHKSAL